MKPISKNDFIKMYKEKSIKDMAKDLDVSRVTIRNWAIRFELPAKRKSLIK